ncbi:MAG: lipocalin family protein [Bacteroidales bacterium]|nr:lipocalin family protein [Bacteroidales bacterium]
MKTTVKSLFVLCFATLFLFCSKEKKLAKRLEGTWNVDKVDMVDATNSSNSYSAVNAGTITFSGNKTGKNDYTYAIGSTSYNQNESFTWSNTEETVAITGNASNGDKVKVFNVDDNKKTTQVWVYAAPDGSVLTYNLTKK